MKHYAQIIISFAKTEEIDRFFTYGIPEHLVGKIEVGMRVKVPFGMKNKYQIGYVMGITNEPPESNYKIKPIFDKIEDIPILSKEQLALVKFLVEYYGTTYAMAIDTILPPGLTEAPLVYNREKKVFYKLSSDLVALGSYKLKNIHKKSFEKQKMIVDLLEDRGRVEDSFLKEQENLSLSSLQTLCKNGMVEKIEEDDVYTTDPIRTECFKKLNDEQENAFEIIREKLNDDKYHGLLLEGVTGSGKTEVFLYAIKETLEKGYTAIVLVPEIALTPQTLTRFKERFGNRVALNHSRMTPVQRMKLYMRVRSGEVDVVIGPRSAVFMPMPRLKLLVVDEEHETTYKSETTPKYHAIEVAKMRMAYNEGVVLLASATPSLESYAQCESGELEKILLRRRATGASLPEVSIVDMRLELKSGNPNVISYELHEAIESTLKEGHQVMLLINRRGHSTFINCRNCGYVVKCKHCDIAMTYHLQSKKLECHHCGSGQEVPHVCPSCESKHIRFFGNGTEKVEEYLNTYFGAYGIGRMDFDTTSGKEGHSKVLSAFREREFNVLVGTQMIAKGHDFPSVALVGIIAADMSLYMQDFRSEERTFQLLTQALGRAGRGDIPGYVVIQTYNPEHPVLLQVKYFQQDAFYKDALQMRESMGYPPFTHLFHLLITGKNEVEVVQKAHMLTHYYQYYNKKKLFRIIGPCAATISRVADEYRWKLVIIGDEREKVLLFGKYCLNKFLKREKVDTIKINWDIDPYTML